MKTYTAGEWTSDAATGDLYENGDLVGKLITGPNGAWLRIIEQANSANQLQALNAELVEALEEMVNTFTAGESGMHLIRLHAIETLARAKSNPHN